MLSDWIRAMRARDSGEMLYCKLVDTTDSMQSGAKFFVRLVGMLSLVGVLLLVFPGWLASNTQTQMYVSLAGLMLTAPLLLILAVLSSTAYGVITTLVPRIVARTAFVMLVVITIAVGIILRRTLQAAQEQGMSAVPWPIVCVFVGLLFSVATRTQGARRYVYVLCGLISVGIFLGQVAWADYQKNHSGSIALEEKSIRRQENVNAMAALPDPLSVTADGPIPALFGVNSTPLVAFVRGPDGKINGVYEWISERHANTGLGDKLQPVSEKTRGEVEQFIQQRIDQLRVDRAAAEAQRQTNEARDREAVRLAEINRQKLAEKEVRDRAVAESQRQEKEAREREAARLAEIKRKEIAELEYQTAHVRTGVLTNNPKTVEVGVSVVGRNGELDEKLANAVSAALKAHGLNASPNVLKELCVADGTFDNVYRGDAMQAHRLALWSSVDYLLLARSSGTSSGPFVDGVMKAQENLEICIILVKDGSVVDKLSIDANGLGFSKQKAEERAREELVKILDARRFESLK